jgi:hypothetical protein
MIASYLSGVASANAQRTQMEMQQRFYEDQARLANVSRGASYRWHDALTNTQVEVPAYRVPRDNCRNCGAPTTSCGCDYCGTP